MALPTAARTARTATVVALGWLALALAAAPAAAQYPPAVEVAVGTPGAVIIIEGDDWSPDTRVTVTYRDADGATATAVTTAGPDGRFSAEVALPADAEPGVAPLEVTGTGADGAPRQWTPSVRVVPDDARDVAAAQPAPAAPAPAPALPATGVLAGPWVAVAGVLLVAGAGALLAARVRTRR